MNPRLRDELPEARRAVLGGDGRGHQAPPACRADPKAEKRGKFAGFQSGAGGGSDDALQAGIWYLMLLNAVADKSPEQAPVCGGEFVPSLETELGIYRGMFEPGQELAKSRLGKTITPDRQGRVSRGVPLGRPASRGVGRRAARGPDASRVRGVAKEEPQTIQALRTSAPSPLTTLDPCRWSRFRRKGSRPEPLIEEFGCK